MTLGTVDPQITKMLVRIGAVARCLRALCTMMYPDR